MNGPGAAGYAVGRPSRTREIMVRGVRYRLREWGPADAEPMFFLHGARDTSATFQFLVDALPAGWRVIAPDWRGHGGSGHTPGSYWQADFVLDFDALLEALGIDGPVALVGHSMGGNVAMLYAGLCPDRVRALVVLDALGSPLDERASAIIDVLDQLRRLQSVRPGRVYDDLATMSLRLQRANRRLDAARADFLAREMACAMANDYRWPFDPTFRRSLPTLHDAGEWSHCWRRIRAPVLLLLSSDPRPGFASADDAHVVARVAHFHDLRWSRLPDTGHNLHHDAPGAVAQAIGAFLPAAT